MILKIKLPSNSKLMLIPEKSTAIEETMETFDSKIEDLEHLNAPGTCLEWSKQGINVSQTLLLDPDGSNYGAAPIPFYCQFPEAIAIFGESTGWSFSYRVII